VGVQRKTAHLQTVSWDESGYASLATDDHAIEFSVDMHQEALEAIGVRVVGGGDPMPVLVSLCKANSWVIYDSHTGDLADLDAEDVSESWHAYAEWRDRVLRDRNA
jgi:hypothetical protein